MPVGTLARYALVAALVGVTALTYMRERDEPQGSRPGPISGSGQQTAPAPKGSSSLAGSGFDYYVLALSWSPSYCAAEGPNANRQQCASGRPYGFVVHGLWPQYERGYPQDCDTAQPRDVPFARANELSDIMPSTGLVVHEWRKHGSCTGLSQRDYFSMIRKAVDRVSVPPAYRQPTARAPVNPLVLEQAFVSANPGLTTGGIAVTCDRDYLREVRICLTKDLDFRLCPEVERSSCRRRSVEMPGTH